jgi:hypothetical protein
MSRAEIRFSGAAAADESAGLTVGQTCYMNAQLFGREVMCLVSSTQPPTPLDDVPFKAMVDPAKIVDTVFRAYVDTESPFDGNLQVLYFDGRTGHAIEIEGVIPDRDAVVYWDPWPGRSLLCAENNPAGVSAQAHSPGNRSWRITRRELETVIYALLVPPWLWAKLHGSRATTLYSEVRGSDFWRWFNLREVRHVVVGDRRVVYCKTGGFQDLVDVTFHVAANDELALSALILDRTFVAGSRQAMFALDLVKSFLRAILPDTDSDEGWALVSLFENLMGGRAQADLSRTRAPQRRSAELDRLLGCYLGTADEAFLMLPTTVVDAANLDHGGRRRFCLAVGAARHASGPKPVVAATNQGLAADGSPQLRRIRPAAPDAAGPGLVP